MVKIIDTVPAHLRNAFWTTILEAVEGSVQRNLGTAEQASFIGYSKRIKDPELRIEEIANLLGVRFITNTLYEISRFHGMFLRRGSVLSYPPHISYTKYQVAISPS